MISEVAPGRVIETVLREAQVGVTKNLGNQKVLEYQTKIGFDVFLAFVGDAWDPVLDTRLTSRVLVDGCQLWNFQDSKVQRAAPETSGYNELSPWIKINEGSTIRYEVDVDNSAALTGGAGAAGNVTARFKVKYAQKQEIR